MTIRELKEILDKAVADGKGDYEAVVLYRDEGGYYNGFDTDITPHFNNEEKRAEF